MSTGICSVCDTAGPIEGHHPAGRRNIPDWIEPLCPDCHRDAGQLLAITGVPMRGGLDDLDVLRAWILAVSQLWALRTARIGNLDRAQLLLTLGLLAATVVDHHGPPDRPGRFLPNPRLRLALSPRPSTTEPTKGRPHD